MPPLKFVTANASCANLLSAAFFFVATPASAGTTYTFTATCMDSRGSRVVEWGVGDVDPGKEFLRVSTGTNYPNFSISDYNASSDSGLPREHLQHAEALWKGIPFLGPLLCKFFC